MTMSSSHKRSLALPAVVVATLALGAVFILRYGVGSLSRVPAWAISAVKLKLELEQDPSSGAFYDRTGGGLLPLATVVREMREAWPDQSVAVIHRAALEVGTGLLHRSDIEMGELVGGKFVPSTSAPWDANERMIAEVKASVVPFENDRVYVFRRK